ncbi:MAG: argininosuccinate lyase [Clostridia bacterium]|nr:argininosuccinate lyase [Clostridia bacterium]
MKLWSGRFEGETDKAADSFNSSLAFDKRLYHYDIEGSKAHCNMLGLCGIIPKNEAELIIETLEIIRNDINDGKIIIENAEDIHSFVENELVSRIGSIGKKLHTGRSRNDQVALDTRLYLRDASDVIISLLKALINRLCDISESNLNTVMPAFTHLQKAQPTTLAHHFMAYAEMFARDSERFIQAKKRINVMPLGSGACTSTAYPIDRNAVAEYLGFPKITANSMDAVSDRDFVIDFLSASAITMMHLSRFSEEIIIWSSDEYKYVELSDKYSTGSSIMPQKKNPDMNELLRGKTGRVYGDLMNMLTVMKGIPLAYDKDMQEDKECVFDAYDTLKACLEIFTALLGDMKINVNVLRKSTDGGFTSATECADYLVKKGVPFRDAHSIIGQLVIYCIKNGKTLQTLTIDEYKSFGNFDNDIFEVIKAENAIALRRAIGAPSPSAMTKEIQAMRELISKI